MGNTMPDSCEKREVHPNLDWLKTKRWDLYSVNFMEMTHILENTEDTKSQDKT